MCLGHQPKRSTGSNFVTSRYASFVDHLAHFAGVRAATASGSLDATVLRARLAPAEAAVAAARAAYTAAVNATTSGTPTFTQFDAVPVSRESLTAAKGALEAERRAAFAAAAAAAGVSPTRSRPEGVEVTVVDGAFLIESDEPINWDRVTLVARRGGVLPQRRDVTVFPEVEFGSPDTGSFVYRGWQWRTTAELWAKGDAVAARLPAAWTLTVELAAATRAEAVVEVASGGSVTLHGDGTGASADTVRDNARREHIDRHRHNAHRMQRHRTGSRSVRSPSPHRGSQAPRPAGSHRRHPLAGQRRRHRALRRSDDRRPGQPRPMAPPVQPLTRPRTGATITSSRSPAAVPAVEQPESSAEPRRVQPRSGAKHGSAASTGPSRPRALSSSVTWPPASFTSGLRRPRERRSHARSSWGMVNVVAGPTFSRTREQRVGGGGCDAKLRP